MRESEGKRGKVLEKVRETNEMRGKMRKEEKLEELGKKMRQYRYRNLGSIHNNLWVTAS